MSNLTFGGGKRSLDPGDGSAGWKMNFHLGWPIFRGKLLVMEGNWTVFLLDIYRMKDDELL